MRDAILDMLVSAFLISHHTDIADIVDTNATDSGSGFTNIPNKAMLEMTKKSFL